MEKEGFSICSGISGISGMCTSHVGVETQVSHELGRLRSSHLAHQVTPRIYFIDPH